MPDPNPNLGEGGRLEDDDQAEEAHLRAGLTHERTADFWDRHGRPDKAQMERARARDHRRAAEAHRANPQQDSLPDA